MNMTSLSVDTFDENKNLKKKLLKYFFMVCSLFSCQTSGQE